MDEDCGELGCGGFPNMDGAALCIQRFTEITLLDIDTDKALDCSESIDKVLWESHPSCVEEYYAPDFCEDLYKGTDELYGCIFALLTPPCYFDQLFGLCRLGLQH